MVNRKSPCSVKKHVRAESDAMGVAVAAGAVMAVPRAGGGEVTGPDWEEEEEHGDRRLKGREGGG